MIIMGCVFVKGPHGMMANIVMTHSTIDPLFSILPIDSEIKFYDLYFSGLFAFGLF